MRLTDLKIYISYNTKDKHYPKHKHKPDIINSTLILTLIRRKMHEISIWFNLNVYT